MAKSLVRQWNADPIGELVVKVYKELGLKATLRGIFLPTRTVDIPTDVSPHFYEPVPLTLKANELVEVFQGEKIVMVG